MRLYEFQEYAMLDEGLIDKLPASLKTAIKNVSSDVINSIPKNLKKILVATLVTIAGAAAQGQTTEVPPEKMLETGRAFLKIPGMEKVGEILIARAQAALSTNNSQPNRQAQYQQDLKTAYDEYNSYQQNSRTSRMMANMGSGMSGSPDVQRQIEYQLLRADQQAYDQTIGRVKAMYGVPDNSRPGSK